MTLDKMLMYCPECGLTKEKSYRSSNYCPDCRRYTMILSNSATAHADQKRKQQKEKRNA